MQTVERRLLCFPLSQFQITQLYDKHLVSSFSVNKVYVYLCRNEILVWHLCLFFVIHHHSGLLPVNLQYFTVDAEP